MSEKAAYRQKIEASMEEWDAEIDKIEARADRAGADMQLQYFEELKKLRALQEVARGKLEELEEAGDDAWEELRNDVDNATNAIERAVNVAVTRFT
ncbi:MAG TPA: coiled coil domain-containing protein [Gammaproteobacteria bacterium]|nr:coiled coil domain-containing protein [Gammaproteobacteria bacterium]